MATDLQATIDQAVGSSTPQQTTIPNQSTAPETPTLTFGESSQSSEPIDSIVTTDQLENPQPLNLPPAPEPERIKTPEVDVEGTLKQIEEANNRIGELRGQINLGRQRDAVKEGFESIGNVSKFEDDLSREIGLQKKREAKTEIDTKIRNRQRKLDLDLREVEDTFGTRAQKNKTKSEIINKGNRALADLALIQLARAGEYNDAKAFVDEKVKLKLQEQKSDLDALIFFYQENKEQFNKADQRAYEKRIKEDDRAYQKNFEKEKQLEDLKAAMTINAAEDGAGNSVLESIQGAASLEALMSLPDAGRYTKSKADRLAEQLQSINIAKASQALDDLDTVAEELTTTGISPVTNKPFTDNQSKAGTFAVRMDQAENVFSFTDPATGAVTLESKKRFLPFVPDSLKSQDRREFEQAERNFITAVLRRESGAAIADSEFEDARRIYIPVAGDSQDILQRKAASRAAVMQGMKNESVGAFEQLQASLQTQSAPVDLGTYVDQIEQNLADPYASLLSGFNTTTTAVQR